MPILNAISPIFILLILGKILSLLEITNEHYLKTSDRLVYYVFFPVMLFWKIGSSAPNMDKSISLCLAAITGVGIVFLASLIAVKIFSIPAFKAGSFSQACYRFNTYIGMALVINVLGESGVRYFGILIGFAIPVINIFAVSTLIWFSGKKRNPLDNIKHLLKALISNPLILGCAAGIIFSRSNLNFPVFVDNTFQLMTSVTMPLALISIGGSLTLNGLKDNTLTAIVATLLKTAVLPVTGYYLLKAFSVTGISFMAGMIFFALPTSTAIYVLSAQLNSDTRTASAAIMLSTLCSFVSLSAVLMLWSA